MQRWTFYDPYLDETFTFASNPYEGGEPNVKKNVNSTRTTAAEGRRIFTEGARSPQEISFRGKVRSLEAQNALKAWVKPYQILWTNDLGEERWIWIRSFSPRRKAVTRLAYKAEYEIRAVVLDIAA